MARDVYERILEVTGGAGAGEPLRDALFVHVTRPSYLRSLTPGAARIGLDGAVVGFVTAIEADAAATLLAVIRERELNSWHRIERDKARNAQRARAHRARLAKICWVGLLVAFAVTACAHDSYTVVPGGPGAANRAHDDVMDCKQKA